MNITNTDLTNETNMMNIEEMKNNVDQVLTDKGMVKDYQDQAVRQLLIGTGFSRVPTRSETS